MIAIDNLESDLTNGLFSKLNAPNNPLRKDIGNSEIINERDKRKVLCYPETVVNDYIPFYFCVKTPMLYNIYTGYTVKKIPQKELIYLCIPMVELANPNFQWCFTNGNAAMKITKYYNSLSYINSIDWHSIKSTDFRLDNADGDEDRIRKKHSEFLVKNHIPAKYIKGIAVYDLETKNKVEEIIQRLGLDILIKVKRDFYF